MFKVKDKHEQIYIVYGVRKDENGETEFLFCNEGEYRFWYWDNAKDYIPVED